MAAIALRRGNSDISSDDYSSDDDGPRRGNGGLGGGGLGGLGGLGGQHTPVRGGLYGSSLNSLQYQPYGVPRRASLARDMSIGSGMGDDLSLMGECDVSSTRSDKNRPGRRASLSAAIELTQEPPSKAAKRPSIAGGAGRPRGRRNSLFGNKNKLYGSDDGGDKLIGSQDGDPTPKPSKKERNRRASMAGYPLGEDPDTTAEPELTPTFFASRKKSSKKDKDKDNDSNSREGKIPSREKSRSFDKNDSRGKSIISSLSKIKRPKGSRRASIASAMPSAFGGGRRGSLSKGESKSSMFSAASNSNSSSYEISDDDEDDIFLNAKRSVPPRSSSYGMERNKAQFLAGKHSRKKVEEEGLGYGDATLYDPQLPPPPKPKPSKRAMQNRRGSTGVAPSGFQTTASAQKSLKESLLWKHDGPGSKPYHPSANNESVVEPPQDRRASAASSIAQSEATHQASNVQEMAPEHARRRLPSDVPPYKKNNTKAGTRGSSLGMMDGSMNSDVSGDEHDLLEIATDRASAGRRTSRGLSILQAPKNVASRDTSQRPSEASALGISPYGSSRREEYDEDEDDDDEIIDEFRPEPQEEQASQKHSTKPSTKEAAKARTVTPEPTETNTVTNDSLTENSKKSFSQKESSGDEVPVGGSSYELPGDESSKEKDLENIVNVDNHSDAVASREAGDWSQGIKDNVVFARREAGDWSQGVTDAALKARAEPRKNSILDSYPESDDEDDLDLGYGPSGKAGEYADSDEDEFGISHGTHPDLYNEDYSSFGWRESRPRAANTIEYVNMEKIISKSKHTKGLYLPNFVPAHGCSNASDFIVRCFVARLRAGMTVTKHSRSRFTKSHDRILHILPSGYHVTWIPVTHEEVTAKAKKSKAPTKLDLTTCLEVRHAWSRDPKSSKYTGTSTLRAKCAEGTAKRSFSLIYKERTIDFTAATVDQCKILMEGFSALCFRLQMARLEQQGTDDDTQTGRSYLEYDDDTATASLTGTNVSTPWGL